jgi:hypothetical protein
MKNIDLVAGLAAMAYAVTAVILLEQGVADLGAHIIQPEAAGVFALAALGRFFMGSKKKEQNHE